jgi:hypothetical protein
MTFTAGAPWALGITGRSRERAAGQWPAVDYTAGARSIGQPRESQRAPQGRFLVDTPLRRYSIGDRSPGLWTNPDGSIDI